MFIKPILKWGGGGESSVIWSSLSLCFKKITATAGRSIKCPRKLQAWARHPAIAGMLSISSSHRRTSPNATSSIFKQANKCPSSITDSSRRLQVPSKKAAAHAPWQRGEEGWAAPPGDRRGCPHRGASLQVHQTGARLQTANPNLEDACPCRKSAARFFSSKGESTEAPCSSWQLWLLIN